MRSRVVRSIPLFACACAVTLSACGSGGTSHGPASAPTGTPAPSPSQQVKSTERDEPVPYLSVATDKGVRVLKQSDLTTVADIPEAAQPALAPLSDGRHVMVTYTKDNRASILDSGSYARAHGDHSHYYTRPPALNAYALHGPKPVHVVSNSGRTAVFFDGDGAATVFEDADLTADRVNDKKVQTGPHHGVVVPMADDSFLVSIPGRGEGLPDKIEHRDAQGKTVASFDCAGMHGEAVRGDMAAFGCKDSVLLVDKGKATTLPYPDKGGQRVGGITADAKGNVFLGDYGTNTLILIRDGKLSLVPAGVDYGARAVLDEGGFVAVGIDGTLRVFDQQGEPQKQVPVVGAWQLSKDHYATRPGLAVIGDNACVSDPGAGKVVCVDTESGAKREATGLATPTAIVATNAQGGTPHTH